MGDKDRGLIGEVEHPTPFVDVPPPAFGKGVRELNPLEKVALRLAVALFILIAVVSVAIVIDWSWHRPDQPTFAMLSTLKLEDQKNVIENYKTLSDAIQERTTKTFDLIVVKAFLPVFATVVGYLLGKRES